MSRIDKAIEVAAKKRSQESQNYAAIEPLPVSSSQSEKPVPGPSIRSSANVANPFLVTANDLNSPAAEQYRKLKSLLVKLSHMGTFDKALMVSSPVAGEGKTITSLNLAITMAQEFDHTVLLVEADVRKPSVMKYLGLDCQQGLSDCVMNNLDIREVLVKTGIGNLSVLPAGTHVENPVELFSSKRMQSLFDELKSRYSDRYLIVDTTPLLPFAEPHYIANAVGAVLLVVREGMTTPEKLKRSIEIIKNNNVLQTRNQHFFKERCA